MFGYSTNTMRKGTIKMTLVLAVKTLATEVR